MAFFPAIIISHSRNFLNFILGFAEGKGFGCLIIPSGVMVFLGIVFRWFIRCSVPFYVAMFRWEILLTVTLLFFIFLFVLERSLSICGLLEGLPARFKKAPINPVHPSLDIAI